MSSGSATPEVDGRFRPEDRLRQRRDFQRVYDEGRRAWTGDFVLFVAPSPAGRHRLGLTVPKRVGNAVMRNRIKRRLREAFRLNRNALPGCYDVVVNARAGAASLPFAELEKAFIAAVHKAAKARPTGPRPQRKPPGKSPGKQRKNP